MQIAVTPSPDVVSPEGQARAAPSRDRIVAAIGEEELLRDLKVLVDLGLVEARPSPDGTRYAPVEPVTADRDGASES